MGRRQNSFPNSTAHRGAAAGEACAGRCFEIAVQGEFSPPPITILHAEVCSAAFVTAGARRLRAGTPHATRRSRDESSHVGNRFWVCRADRRKPWLRIDRGPTPARPRIAPPEGFVFPFSCASRFSPQQPEHAAPRRTRKRAANPAARLSCLYARSVLRFAVEEVLRGVGHARFLARLRGSHGGRQAAGGVHALDVSGAREDARRFRVHGLEQ